MGVKEPMVGVKEPVVGVSATDHVHPSGVGLRFSKYLPTRLLRFG